ncbi:hypothetical protein J7355_16750 [Endozoicomonas sp. G2_2]|uniref:hypothetical protein n=1 Tax=Endozoicomonas sp. G2_2 TaxID=2821092 RepID=UPI001AD983CB|nr:hypothetical protein [Endozoicomonas sp. G2_2]MBO9471742.1 hypothetical protein [Endozoicomonas sp. G2_2]
MRRWALGLLVAASPALAWSACDRTDRVTVYQGRAVPVYAADDQYAEVKFPEALRGLLPEQPAGISINQAAFPDRIFIKTEEDGQSYNAQVLVQSASGNSYRLQVIERACADGTVSVVDESPALAQKHVGSGDEGREPGKQRLIKYMVSGATPSGYQIQKATGSPQQRLVLEQGSVAFYLEETWRGAGGDTGIVLLAVNRGRTPFRVAIDNIEFGSRELIEQFGHVREISMMPSDFRLDPAPEFAADAARAQNKGLVYIVSNRNRRTLHGTR